LNIYKVMLGKGSQYAQQAIAGSFIGIDDTTGCDLTAYLELPEPAFRQQVRALLEAVNPGSTKKGTISQYTTTLWRIALGLQAGDVVISPDGTAGQLRVGDVTGGYVYQAGAPLPHRRAVQWRPQPIRRADMTLELQNSSGGITTIIDLSGYAAEVLVLAGGKAPLLLDLGVTVSPDPVSFRLEKELENFLVANWASTELGQDYTIYRDEASGAYGQQYPTSTGPIDILAVKKDQSELLVIELKRGRPSDTVIGQIQRYMGFLKQEVAETGQQVSGLIIALNDDPKLQLALLVAPNIRFYTYQVSFKLNHAGGDSL
jgi:restriction system protein